MEISKFVVGQRQCHYPHVVNVPKSIKKCGYNSNIKLRHFSKPSNKSARRFSIRLWLKSTVWRLWKKSLTLENTPLGMCVKLFPRRYKCFILASLNMLELFFKVDWTFVLLRFKSLKWKLSKLRPLMYLNVSSSISDTGFSCSNKRYNRLAWVNMNANRMRILLSFKYK